MNESIEKCGFVAIVGRPNVGKSTLMNRMLGQKISITSKKPQTTRHRILGIKSTENYQIIYVDTPGMHLGGKSAMNRYMNKAASTVLSDVDLILFVVDTNRWTEEDENVLKKLRHDRVPVILVINKIDLIKQKEKILPVISELGDKMKFSDIVPVSAFKNDNLNILEELVVNCIPEGNPLFPVEQVTDKSERFMASEIVREKLMRRLQQELPYSLTAEIERFSLEKNILYIDSIIWVERESQKKIVIGKSGSVLKDVGKAARKDMQHAFGHKVHLQLWVKVKEGWSDSENLLKRMGYDDVSI
ncbi:MAG TPA: GTPase Era [Gammaproteobacteria bacterium]|nr:GTPase Era [Gammaproteobacteria bacterium]